MKAILVIDEMPESCKDCLLKYFDNGDDAYFGGVTERCVIDGSEISMNGRYDDCPLKPLPKEKESRHTEDYCDGWAEGWNACLEALENSQNGEDSNE